MRRLTVEPRVKQCAGRTIACLAVLVAAQLALAAQSPPNLVVIVADDLGWGDVGYHGSQIATPRLDALAAEGVVLDRFYAQPTCSPTRAALMTGKTPMRLGVLSPISKNNPTGLPLGERVLPEHFRDAGYQTFMTGKWHLGHRGRDYLPNSRGFDHFYGHVTGGIGYWDHVHGGGFDWQRNGKTLREEGYSTRLIADPLFLFWSASTEVFRSRPSGWGSGSPWAPWSSCWRSPGRSEAWPPFAPETWSSGSTGRPASRFSPPCWRDTCPPPAAAIEQCLGTDPRWFPGSPVPGARDRVAASLTTHARGGFA